MSSKPNAYHDAFCPCGSRLAYIACCGLYHQGIQVANTPEILMRSRYTAYALGDMAYIKRTMAGKASLGFNPQDAGAWAKSVEWVQLTILQTQHISAEQGYVEFKASFIENGRKNVLHEVSEFKRVNNTWFYVDGVQPQEDQLLKPLNSTKVGRNTLCPCGSHKKFKHCHGKSI